MFNRMEQHEVLGLKGCQAALSTSAQEVVTPRSVCETQSHSPAMSGFPHLEWLQQTILWWANQREDAKASCYWSLVDNRFYLILLWSSQFCRFYLNTSKTGATYWAREDNRWKERIDDELVILTSVGWKKEPQNPIACFWSWPFVLSRSK